jgi:protein-S-isoprenylcysteine O-methyltransferase Ste14
MLTLFACAVGLLTFAIGTWVLGAWLRRHRWLSDAEKPSRIVHFLFFAGVVLPPLAVALHPGFPHVDALVGVKPLPWRPAFLVLGIALAMPGSYLLGVTHDLLRALGSGANAFRLTKPVVSQGIYERTRNPMSLGFYLLAAATGFLSGSTVVTLGALLGVIPAHVFFLQYFEELELELRLGEPYVQYKKSVPFLIPSLGARRRTLA